MIYRNDKGKLAVKSLDMSIFFDDLFENCKTESEIEWLNEQIISCIDGAVQDKKDSLVEIE